MKILTTSTTNQTIKIIPRSYPQSVDLYLQDEVTNQTTTFNDVSTYEEKGYLVFLNTYSLKEGRFYNLTVKDGETTIHKCKIFCTDQSDYSVNENVYIIEDSQDNEFIVL